MIQPFPYLTPDDMQSMLFMEPGEQESLYTSRNLNKLRHEEMIDEQLEKYAQTKNQRSTLIENNQRNSLFDQNQCNMFTEHNQYKPFTGINQYNRLIETNQSNLLIKNNDLVEPKRCRSMFDFDLPTTKRQRSFDQQDKYKSQEQFDYPKTIRDDLNVMEPSPVTVSDEGIFLFTEEDVLSGRGGGNNAHPDQSQEQFDYHATIRNDLNVMEPAPVKASDEGIFHFKEEDVLSGRGGGTNVHPGNCVFRDLINLHRRSYLKASKNEKPKISRAIVAVIREQNGRFLRQDGMTNLWFEIGDHVAREKTSQALRQKATEMRKILLKTERAQTKHQPQSPPQSTYYEKYGHLVSPSDVSLTTNDFEQTEHHRTSQFLLNVLEREEANVQW